MRLGVSDFASLEEIGAKIKGSKYSKDYIMTEDFVRNVWAKEIDPLFKRADRDVDSVLLAVCSDTACLTLCHA